VEVSNGRKNMKGDDVLCWKNGVEEGVKHRCDV
jgi:hypothetical protein